MRISTIFVSSVMNITSENDLKQVCLYCRREIMDLFSMIEGKPTNSTKTSRSENVKLNDKQLLLNDIYIYSLVIINKVKYKNVIMINTKSFKHCH